MTACRRRPAGLTRRPVSCARAGLPRLGHGILGALRVLGSPQSCELACAPCTPFNITMIRFGTKQCRVACRFCCLQNLSEMDRSSW